jgi:ABC-2 type transport system ATP-binding protein
VFVSSHLMSEMALTASELIVVGRGHLVASGTVADLTRLGGGVVLVRTDDPERLAELVVNAGGAAVGGGADRLTVSGLDSRQVGRLAADHGIALIELTPQSATLEEAFMEITRGDVEFHGNTAVASAS